MFPINCFHFDCPYMGDTGCKVTACINPNYNGSGVITYNRTLTAEEYNELLKKKNQS